MKPIFSTLLLILISFACNAQQDTISYTVRYNKIKELYLKQLESQSRRTLINLSLSFYKKMQASPWEQIRPLDECLPWIKANLNQTSFKSFEEAEKDWAAIEAAKDNEYNENKEYHDYIVECMLLDNSSKFLIDACKEVEAEHPELFPKPVCPVFKS